LLGDNLREVRLLEAVDFFLSTLLDQFMEQNFGPHMEQNADSL
jgi:hypothetical protein